MKRTAKSFLGRLTQLSQFTRVGELESFLNHEFTTYHCQPGYDNSRKPEECLWSEPEPVKEQCDQGKQFDIANNFCTNTQSAVNYCRAGTTLKNPNSCVESAGMVERTWVGLTKTVYISNGVAIDAGSYDNFSYQGWDYIYKETIYKWPPRYEGLWGNRYEKTRTSNALKRCPADFSLQGDACVKSRLAVINYDGTLKCGRAACSPLKYRR